VRDQAALASRTAGPGLPSFAGASEPASGLSHNDLEAVTWQDAAGPSPRNHHRSGHAPEHAELRFKPRIKSRVRCPRPHPSPFLGRPCPTRVEVNEPGDVRRS
jgi:hypothetical protein